MTARSYILEELPPVLAKPRDEVAENAYRAAVDSRRIDIDEEAIAELEHDARAIAQGLNRSAFAPDDSVADHFRRKRADEDAAAEREADQAEAIALGTVEARRDELASLPDPGPEPEPSRATASSAILVISVVLGVTLHDRVFQDVPDWVLQWLFSLGIGALPGLLVVAFMLWSFKTGRRTAANYVGLIAGIVIGLGALAIRVSDSAARDDLWLALGLTMLELSTVIYLDVYATRIRSDYALWSEHMEAKKTAGAYVENAERTLTGRRRRLDAIRGRLDAHGQHLDERYVRSLPLEKLQDIIVSCVRPAYVAGIEYNRSLRLPQLRRVT